MFELPGFGLRIKPLWIAPDAFLERSVNEDLEKRGGSSQFSYHLPFGAKWRNERANHDHPRLGHQLGDFADAPDVFNPVSVSETEIAIEAVAHIVAIEQHCVPSAGQQLLLDEIGDRRFPGA